MAQPWSVETLAREVNLSASHFRRLFRTTTGASPMRHLQGLRLGRARLLIERTFLSVKEVMALVGIADPSHFARDFSRAFGVSPTEARRRHQIRQASADLAKWKGDRLSVKGR